LRSARGRRVRSSRSPGPPPAQPLHGQGDVADDDTRYRIVSKRLKLASTAPPPGPAPPRRRTGTTMPPLPNGQPPPTPPPTAPLAHGSQTVPRKGMRAQVAAAQRHREGEL